ncbi:MAG: DUF11 domain-containing protein [Candidatus Pacebacteria bacterium]|nr:DUF11 domain-containing protein [Candidatus Paceibacterota bacterium]
MLVLGQTTGPRAITAPATDITPTTATLNATYSSGGFSDLANPPQVFFHFATTSAGLNDPSVRRGTQPFAKPFSEHRIVEPISGLTPGQRYFFRAVTRYTNENNQQIEVFGGEESFIASGGQAITAPTPAPAPTNRITATSEDISFMMSNGIETISLGEVFDYVISITNNRTTPLTVMTLYVDLPTEMQIMRITGAQANTEGNESSVSMQLGSLQPNDTRIIRISARVRTVPRDATLTARAQLLYTRSNQQYIGSAFDSDMYGGGIMQTERTSPVRMLGWIIIFGFLILLIFIILYYRKKSKEKAYPSLYQDPSGRITLERRDE